VFAPPKEFMNRNAVNITVGGGMMGNPNYYTDGSAGGGLDFRVADPRGTGGALEGSPRGPQQQNPYDSLKKLFGGNLQRSGGGFGGGLQDLFGRIGQQTGQMQGSPTNSQYEGRNPDGSSFRSQFPMGNNEPVLRNQPALLGQFRPQPPMPQDQKPGFEGLDQAYINQSMQQQSRNKSRNADRE
jgi:hypothetical protein